MRKKLFVRDVLKMMNFQLNRVGIFDINANYLLTHAHQPISKLAGPQPKVRDS